MPYSGGQPLHVSELELPDHPGSKEVRDLFKRIFFNTKHELIFFPKTFVKLERELKR